MVSNPNTFSEAGTSSLGQIKDGQDFPHTGLLKSLAAGVAGNYVISGFDITPTGNGSTTGTVGNGVDVCIHVPTGQPSGQPSMQPTGQPSGQVSCREYSPC